MPMRAAPETLAQQQPWQIGDPPIAISAAIVPSNRQYVNAHLSWVLCTQLPICPSRLQRVLLVSGELALDGGKVSLTCGLRCLNHRLLASETTATRAACSTRASTKTAVALHFGSVCSYEPRPCLQSTQNNPPRVKCGNRVTRMEKEKNRAATRAPVVKM